MITANRTRAIAPNDPRTAPNITALLFLPEVELVGMSEVESLR